MGVMTGLLIGGLVLQTVQQIRSANAAGRAGEAGRDVAESQADLADSNAALADLQARDAIERGAEQESNFRMGVRGMVGKQRAQLAGGNIDVSYGSAVDLQADTAYMGELDSLTIRNNAAREAWGFKTQGADLRARAEIARREGVMLERQGQEAKRAGYIGAATTVIGGGASLYAQRYGMHGTTGGNLASRQTVPTMAGLPAGGTGLG